MIEIIGVTDNLHQFFRQENLAPSSQIPALNVDQSIAALELAANGMGHALVSELFALPYLQDGRLARSLPLENTPIRRSMSPARRAPSTMGLKCFWIGLSSGLSRSTGRWGVWSLCGVLTCTPVRNKLFDRNAQELFQPVEVAGEVSYFLFREDIP